MRSEFARGALTASAILAAFFPASSRAEPPPPPVTHGQRLAALCAGPRRAVQSMLEEYQGRSTGFCPVDVKYAELNIKSIEEHCAELERNKELLPGRFFRDVVSREFVSDVENAVKEVRGFLTCAVGGQAGAQQAYIKRLMASPVAWGNHERTLCLGEKLKKIEAMRDAISLDALDKEVLACVAPAVERDVPTVPAWATTLTVTGGVLLAGGVSTLIWGVAASCVHQESGYCTNAEVDRVNHRRYAAYVAAGFAAAGAAVVTAGVFGLVRSGSSSKTNISLVIGPSHVGVKGSF